MNNEPVMTIYLTEEEFDGIIMTPLVSTPDLLTVTGNGTTIPRSIIIKGVKFQEKY